MTTEHEMVTVIVLLPSNYTGSWNLECNVLRQMISSSEYLILFCNFAIKNNESDLKLIYWMVQQKEKN